MTEWRTVTLAEISEKPMYGAIARGVTGAVGPLFVRQTDISRGRINWASVPYCDLDNKDTARYSLRRGDLLISRLGNGVGNAATVTDTREDAVFAGYLVRFRPDPAVADFNFIGYQLQSDGWRNHVTGFRSGAAQPTLNAQQMGDFRFSLPPLPEQRAIAAVLHSLDDKIESNSAIVALIPKLIRARVNAAIALQPQKTPVADLGTFVNGGAYTNGASGTGRMVLRIAELNSGPGPSTVYNDIQVPEEKTARPGDLLMSWSGSLGVYRWFRDEAIVNQHIFKVTPVLYPPWLIFDRLDAVMPVFRGMAKDKATTMGHIQRGHLQSTVVDLPSAEQVRDLDVLLSLMWERLVLAEVESEHLKSLRNTLLSELLSGRIRAADFKEILS
jgi:type I restriction enzyme S subunit